MTRKINYDGWELEFFDKADNFRNYQFDLIKKSLKGRVAEIGQVMEFFLINIKILLVKLTSMNHR